MTKRENTVPGCRTSIQISGIDPDGGPVGAAPGASAHDIGEFPVAVSKKFGDYLSLGLWLDWLPHRIFKICAAYAAQRAGGQVLLRAQGKQRGASAVLSSTAEDEKIPGEQHKNDRNADQLWCAHTNSVQSLVGHRRRGKSNRSNALTLAFPKFQGRRTA
jgi:hypothetical protein